MIDNFLHLYVLLIYQRGGFEDFQRDRRTRSSERTDHHQLAGGLGASVFLRMERSANDRKGDHVTDLIEIVNVYEGCVPSEWSRKLSVERERGSISVCRGEITEAS